MRSGRTSGTVDHSAYQTQFGYLNEQRGFKLLGDSIEWNGAGDKRRHRAQRMFKT